MHNFEKISDIKNASDVQWIITMPNFWSGNKSIILKAAEIANINEPGIINHTII